MVFESVKFVTVRYEDHCPRNADPPLDEVGGNQDDHGGLGLAGEGGNGLDQDKVTVNDCST